MSKVSIIIPARGEKYLVHTLDSIYRNATGEFEVIVGFNGRPFEKLEYILNCNLPNLKVFITQENIGLKPMINTLAKLATGEYLYKSDAHCAFSKGFDEVLQKDMEDDWIVTPRFYVLDKRTWKWQDERFYDYFYLSCPFTDKRGLRFKAGGHWPERTKERLPQSRSGFEALDALDEIYSPFIDETPQIHGSGWFVNRRYFLDYLDGFPEEDWDGHAQEPIWLALKNWLIGGKVMVNKNAWYAHLHQDSSERGYPEDKNATENTYRETARYWLHQPIEKFLEKFPDMPTWPDNWRELLENFRKEDNGKTIFG